MYACEFIKRKQLNELRTLFSEMLIMQLRNTIPLFGAIFQKNLCKRRSLQLDDEQLTDAK